ncbi:hypothetical protein LJC55_04385 [Eubacteriales bacterium OttesenSCG-928-N14]|nr:hypothetical protein [Eubacteriales bacterium OttesenSCG-928-N14]
MCLDIVGCQNSDNIMDILTTLAHNSGYCVVVVTHNAAVAEASDILYTMKDGHLTLETA